MVSGRLLENIVLKNGCFLLTPQTALKIKMENGDFRVDNGFPMSYSVFREPQALIDSLGGSHLLILLDLH